MELQLLQVVGGQVSRLVQLASWGQQRNSRWRRVTAGILLAFPGLLLTSCSAGTTSSSSPGTSTSTSAEKSAGMQVVAVENFWGSIASQLGGNRVKVTSIITNPDTDPHDYDPKPTDARLVANARYAIVNGAGYDPWVSKLLSANPVNGRKVLNVGELVGKKEGDNPHLWYNPGYVKQTVDQITADLKSLDPADAVYFDQERTRYLTVALKSYNDTISTIKQKYAGTPIAVTESIFAYMATSLGLNLTTPPKFMNAISEGQEPTAADKATFDKQVTQKQIKVFVYNKQNATPDTNALKQKAQSAGIPIVPITETLAPATSTFQEWQVGQLQALQQALAKSTNH